jgi:hypothetical protein
MHGPAGLHFVSEEAFFVQGAKKRHHVASPVVE